MSLSKDDTSGLDDGAFAVVQGGDEIAGTAPDVKVRELPLYESAKHHYSGIPHKGLIKAALDGLGQDKDGNRKYTRDVHSEALRRVRSAHSQLTGDYSMALTVEELAKHVDPLQADLAKVRGELLAASTELANKVSASNEGEKLLKDQIALKDTEIANLQAKLDEFQKAADEAAALKVAETRLDDLAKIEGFEVKDTEKAALLDALSKESDDQFKNRILTEENAALQKRLASGAGPVKDKKSDELAGLKLVTGAKVVSDSPYAALLS
jgi:hypothetical protein